MNNSFKRVFKRSLKVSLRHISLWKACKVFDWRRNLSLRRGISVLIGGALERLFCPERGGGGIEQANLQKFKCPGGCPGRDVELSNWLAHKFGNSKFYSMKINSVLYSEITSSSSITKACLSLCTQKYGQLTATSKPGTQCGRAKYCLNICNTNSVTYPFYCIFRKLPRFFNFSGGMTKSCSVERKLYRRSRFLNYKKFH